MTGKAGNMTWNGTAIPITSAKPKVAKAMADSTDSSNYDAGTQQLYKAQLPGDWQMTLAVEGFFDRTITPTTVLAALVSNATVEAVVKIDGSTTFVDCFFDVSDFDMDITVPGAVMVGYTCTMMSNGKPNNLL